MGKALAVYLTLYAVEGYAQFPGAGENRAPLVVPADPGFQSQEPLPSVPLQTITPLPTINPAGRPAVSPGDRNCNFAVRATEDFANRVIARCQTEDGPVRDCILGASVFGDQSTTTSTRLNFRPCASAARFELEVQGEVDSRTVGVTPQAQICTRGRHQFLLSKEIEFDGQLTRTRSPSVTVAPCQQHVGAATVVSGVPLIGPLAEGIALQQATARNPIAARITAGKITQQAAPEFNQRIDAELGRLNELLSGKARQQLEAFRLAPVRQTLSSTETDLLWCVTLDVPTAAPPLPATLSAGSAARAGGLYLHDSLVNDLLDRLPLAGVGVPDVAIDRWFKALAGGDGLAALSHGGGPMEPQFATILFDRQHPIRLRFEEQQFALVLRLGFIPVVGPPIPSQELTIPFTVSVSADAVHFRPGAVQIAPADPQQPGGVLDEAARTIIREQVQQRLESRTAPRRIPVQLPDSPATEVQVRDVTLQNGWLSVEFD